MNYIHDYEPVIGLEIHGELMCASKIFCSCPTGFGAKPNTQVCPVCLGLPGALPTLNKRAVVLGIRAGIALGCRIQRVSRFDRKNYFYPDLPKAYQITQFFQPLCTDGRITVPTPRGGFSVGITRIHLEEDAGKLVHEGSLTRMDANRCGVPLIEIVTEPEIFSPEDAADFTEYLRQVLLFAGVCDGKMQEGSLRCDVNLSVRKRGETALGTRTEMKNLNSFTFIRKAIEYEYARQAEILHRGGRIRPETRRFDADTCRTEPMRSKEEAADYRYFPEANLPPLVTDEKTVEEIRKGMPTLPAEYRRIFSAAGVPEKDEAVLLSDPEVCAYLKRTLACNCAGRTLSSLLVYCLSGAEDFCRRVDHRRFGEVARLLDEGRINNGTARSLLLWLAREDFDPVARCEAENLWLISDPEVLVRGISQVLSAEAAAVESVKNGKIAAKKMLMGKCMAHFSGKADPRRLEEYLNKKLDE